MHPHPDSAHVRRAYRSFLLGTKRKLGSARGLVHHRDLVRTYLWTKGRYLGPWRLPT